MTKEEAEAIKSLNEFAYTIHGTLSTGEAKIILNLIEENRERIRNKNKVIDLMAEMINNQDIDEDICKQMGQKENCNEFEEKSVCIECIKQYFENKAKKVE